ncbi:unnamed protein product, partial [Allacma fusca]
MNWSLITLFIILIWFRPPWYPPRVKSFTDGNYSSDSLEDANDINLN